MASGGVHIVSGFVIGALAPSAASGFAAGVASHAVLDAVPHREYVTWTANALETGAAILLTAAMTTRLPKGARLKAVAGAVGGILPDVETVAYQAGFMPAERKVFPTHTGRIRHGHGGWMWTAALSVLAVAAAAVVVRRSRRSIGPAG